MTFSTVSAVPSQKSAPFVSPNVLRTLISSHFNYFYLPISHSFTASRSSLPSLICLLTRSLLSLLLVCLPPLPPFPSLYLPLTRFGVAAASVGEREREREREHSASSYNRSSGLKKTEERRERERGGKSERGILFVGAKISTDRVTASDYPRAVSLSLSPLGLIRPQEPQRETTAARARKIESARFASPS